MEVLLNFTQLPVKSSSLVPSKASTSVTFRQRFVHSKQTRFRKLHRSLIALASMPDNQPDSNSLFWPSLGQAMGKFFSETVDMVKREAGINVEEYKDLVAGIRSQMQEAVTLLGIEFDRFRFQIAPEFVSWNKWEHWKDVRNWGPERIGALVFYVFIFTFSCQSIFLAIKARQRRVLVEEMLEELIPEINHANFRKLKKNAWRKMIPKGLKVKRFIQGPDGTLVHDTSFVGEDAWEDDAGQVADREQNRLAQDMDVSGEAQGSPGSWKDRLHSWDEFLKREKLYEKIKSYNAKYEYEFDTKELENSLRQEVEARRLRTQNSGELFVSKTWWLYRPKLPYIFFFERLKKLEVEAVVMTEDAKRMYVTMKEGFPKEYIVDIPLDPYLFSLISRSGTEVDFLQKSELYYLFRVVRAFLPGMVILWLLNTLLFHLCLSAKQFYERRIYQLCDSMERNDVILSKKGIDGTNSMMRELVMGGDVWDLLDELMMYLRNPMQFYAEGVTFVRGVLLYGPPGTGKTLFARTLAKESGLPLVFASGADFAEGERSGVSYMLEIFLVARRNAPCFLFVDEIDAIAGKHVRDDPRRQDVFDTLIEQLDGAKEDTGVDRFSIDQAVIFICATNRPNDLDPELLCDRRIDRCLCVGLPDPKQQARIFHVHSAGISLSEDVDFEKLLFRVGGYSGADIRNLVNEATIMSVRKGHSKVCQQDIIDVLDKQLLEGMGVLLTEEERQKCERSVSFVTKRLLAVHEAGHVVLAHLFPRFDWHAFSQLLPEGKETAISIFHPREEMVQLGYTTFGYLQMQMVVAHGGRCAERIVFGEDVTDGGNDDLEKITRIAREMVISPSNKKLGLTAMTRKIDVWEPSKRFEDFDREVIKYRWDDPRVVQENISVELSELFTRELSRYIKETEDMAMDGLEKNRHILDLIAEELLEKSIITGIEVEERLRDLSPIMFEDFVDINILIPETAEMRKESIMQHIPFEPVDVRAAPLHRC